MNRVNMEGLYDCGAACLAMALGFKNARDVYPMLGYDPSKSAVKGIGDCEALGVLYSYDKRCRFYVAAEKVAEAWDVSMDLMHGRNVLRTRHELQIQLGMQQHGCAIVAVPSLSGYAHGHFVFCQRGEMHDPAVHPHKRYNGTANSLPVDAVIFIGD